MRQGQSVRTFAAALLVLLVLACGDGPTDPAGPLAFAPDLWPLTGSSVEVLWGRVDGAEGYVVEYMLFGQGSTEWTLWATVSSSTTADTIHSLAPDKLYSVRVGAFRGEQLLYSSSGRVWTRAFTMNALQRSVVARAGEPIPTIVIRTTASGRGQVVSLEVVAPASLPVTLTSYATPGIHETLPRCPTVCYINGVADREAPAGEYLIVLNASSERGTKPLSDTVRVELLEPLPVHSSLGRPDRLRLGGGHTCLLVEPGTGEWWCWGDNSYGQLGRGMPSGADAEAPQELSKRFRELSAGKDHICALDSAGNAFCWGNNRTRQLGVTELAPPDQPEWWGPARVSSDVAFKAIEAGWRHTCALDVEGRAYCWGQGVNGELGNASRDTQPAPEPVQTEIDFEKLAVGDGYTCGLTSSGEAYCWGQIAGLIEGASFGVPALIESVPGFVDIAAEEDRACGVTAGGALYCWSRETRPELQEIGVQLASLSAGWGHSCGLSMDGGAYCWGRDTEGQLGRLDTGFEVGWGIGSTCRSSTQANTWTRCDSETASPVANGLDLLSVRAGQYHSCGITTTLSVVCWGGLGTGEVAPWHPRAAPIRVAVALLSG